MTVKVDWKPSSTGFREEPPATLLALVAFEIPLATSLRRLLISPGTLFLFLLILGFVLMAVLGLWV